MERWRKVYSLISKESCFQYDGVSLFLMPVFLLNAV